MPLTALSVKKQRVMREVSRTGWRARRGYCEYFLGNQAKAKASESGSTCLGDGLLSAYQMKGLLVSELALFLHPSIAP